MTKRSISLIVGDEYALVLDEWGCIVEVVDAERVLSDEEQLEIIMRLENEQL